MRKPGRDEPSPSFALEECLSNARWIQRRETFYQRALGPFREPGVYHFEDDGDPHVDIYAIKAGRGRDHEILITGGMADRPLPSIPAGSDRPRRVEVLTAMHRAEAWAAMILREIATVPFLTGEVFDNGTLIQGSRAIVHGSPLRHAVLEWSGDPALHGFVVEGEEVRFLEVRFVTEAELGIGIADGGPALLRALDRAGIGLVLEPERRCILAG